MRRWGTDWRRGGEGRVDLGARPLGGMAGMEGVVPQRQRCERPFSVYCVEEMNHGSEDVALDRRRTGIGGRG